MNDRYKETGGERAVCDLENLREMERIVENDTGSWRKKREVDPENSKEVERGRVDKNVRAEIKRAGIGECQGDRWIENETEI